jgi:hypothetical protein
MIMTTKKAQAQKKVQAMTMLKYNRKNQMSLMNLRILPSQLQVTQASQ